MGGIASVLYGAVVYALFLGTFLYAIAFVGNLPVPKTIDSGAPGPLIPALVINTLLLGLFAIQHSVMARPAFKRWWTRFVPQPVERTTYVLLASLALVLLFWQWRPIPAPVWTVDQSRSACSPCRRSSGLAGRWCCSSTFLINHFELFGLRQVCARLRGQHAAGAGIPDAVPLQARAPSDLSRLPARLLGDAGHDRRATCCSRWRPPAIS